MGMSATRHFFCKKFPAPARLDGICSSLKTSQAAIRQDATSHD
jgi:hypothetical protein